MMNPCRYCGVYDWVLLEDERPEPGVNVLVCDGEECFVASMHETEDYFVMMGGFVLDGKWLEKVKVWMPLPEVPNASKA